MKAGGGKAKGGLFNYRSIVLLFTGDFGIPNKQMRLSHNGIFSVLYVTGTSVVGVNQVDSIDPIPFFSLFVVMVFLFNIEIFHLRNVWTFKFSLF